jgi:hypothetical protein
MRACAPDARLSTQKAAHLLIRRINCLGRPLDRLRTGPQSDLTLRLESALQIQRLMNPNEPLFTPRDGYKIALETAIKGCEDSLFQQGIQSIVTLSR